MKKKIPFWIKTGVVGGLWGFISIFLILTGIIEQSGSLSIIYYILSAPAWVLVIIGSKIMGIGGSGELLFLFAPLFGAFITVVIGYLYNRFR